MKQIQASIRQETGKGAARRMRQAGQIPGTLYAQDSEPLSLTLDLHALLMVIQEGGFFTHKHTLELGSDKVEVLARDMQRDPVSGKILHIDFMRFDPNKAIRVTVPVHVSGEGDSPGLEKGGVLQLLRAELELICKASSIPEAVEISVADKDIGDSVHLSEINLPEGSRSAIYGRDFTIASIVGTRLAAVATTEDEEEGDGTAAAEDDAATDDHSAA